MSIVGALTSGLGNTCNYLYSCCTKRAAVTAMAVGSLAAVVWYQYSMTTPEEEEECPPLTNMGNGQFCNEDEGYCFQRGPVNFDSFVKYMEKALEVIKGCPASNDLFEEVKANGPVVFQPVQHWEQKFSGEEGNNVAVDPKTLERDTLPGLVTREFFRLLPQAKKDWEDIKDGACANSPGPHPKPAAIDTFVRNCLRFDQHVFRLYHEVASSCIADGIWKPKLDLYGPDYNLLPWDAFDEFYDAMKEAGRHLFYARLRKSLC